VDIQGLFGFGSLNYSYLAPCIIRSELHSYYNTVVLPNMKWYHSHVAHEEFTVVAITQLSKRSRCLIGKVVFVFVFKRIHVTRESAALRLYH
jgi:hypothetical protein